jgi:hypothetical protein
MKRPELIPNWRKSWRYLSVQIAAAGVIFGSLPADTQAAMLDAVGIAPSRLPAILGLLVLVGRLISQRDGQ